MAAPAIESMQCFRHKKTTVAVTYCKKGAGDPPLLGRHHFAGVDMRIRIKGGGHTSQIYAICQSIAKALVAYYQKYVDKQAKKEIKVRLYSPRRQS